MIMGITEHPHLSTSSANIKADNCTDDYPGTKIITKIQYGEKNLLK